MKRGHVYGTKRERPGTRNNWWYHTPEAEAMIQQLEREWQAKQAAQEQE